MFLFFALKSMLRKKGKFGASLNAQIRNCNKKLKYIYIFVIQIKINIIYIYIYIYIFYINLKIQS